MDTVAVVLNGPKSLIPDLTIYKKEVNCWIGADKGALTIIENNLRLAYALGDFDSVQTLELEKIKLHAESFSQYPIEKDKTDAELALEKALSRKPDEIYLFGATGGRIDHMLMNIQLLRIVRKQHSNGIIVDKQNWMELKYPGTYTMEKDDFYPTISFISLSEEVTGLTLKGFYYPLTNETIKMGSSLSISNQLFSNIGTFSFTAGIVLVVRSRDSK